LDDVDEFSCADSDARAEAQFASETRFRCIPGSSGEREEYSNECTGVGLSDMGSSANVRSNLTKIPNQGGSGHQSAFEVRDKFKQFFNSPSGSVLWQNERV